MVPIRHSLKRRPPAPTPAALQAPATDASPSHPEPAADSPDDGWRVDRGCGGPAPVIRANMISLRLSYQGRIKVAFFEQD